MLNHITSTTSYHDTTCQITLHYTILYYVFTPRQITAFHITPTNHQLGPFPRHVPSPHTEGRALPCKQHTRWWWGLTSAACRKRYSASVRVMRQRSSECRLDRSLYDTAASLPCVSKPMSMLALDWAAAIRWECRASRSAFVMSTTPWPVRLSSRSLSPFLPTGRSRSCKISREICMCMSVTSHVSISGQGCGMGIRSHGIRTLSYQTTTAPPWHPSSNVRIHAHRRLRPPQLIPLVEVPM